MHPFSLILRILFLVSHLVTANFNPNISNGICYSAPGQKLDGSFIPCGNADGGHLPCCEARDNCLSSQACFSPNFRTTYLAGCTDESYTDKLCPNKGIYANNSWAGMIDCPTGSAEWYVCEDTQNQVTYGAPCSCAAQSSYSAAFTDAPTLTGIVYLPYAAGGSLNWQIPNTTFNGHLLSTSFGPDYYSSVAGRNTAPSLSSSSSSAALSSASSLRQLTASSTAFPSNIASSTSSTTPAVTSTAFTSPSIVGTSIGARTGIGIGVAGGAIVLGLLIWGWMVCLRRRRKSDADVPAESPTNLKEARWSKASQQSNMNTVRDVEKDLRSPAWSGHKSELSADETAMISPAPTYNDCGSARSSRVNISPKKPFGLSELSGDKGSGVYEMPG